MPNDRVPIQTIIEWVNDRDSESEHWAGELTGRVESVLGLHLKARDTVYGGIYFCRHCSALLGHGMLESWPCPTIRVLDGETLAS